MIFNENRPSGTELENMLASIYNDYQIVFNDRLKQNTMKKLPIHFDIELNDKIINVHQKQNILQDWNYGDEQLFKLIQTHIWEIFRRQPYDSNKSLFLCFLLKCKKKNCENTVEPKGYYDFDEKPFDSNYSYNFSIDRMNVYFNLVLSTIGLQGNIIKKNVPFEYYFEYPDHSKQLLKIYRSKEIDDYEFELAILPMPYYYKLTN